MDFESSTRLTNLVKLSATKINIGTRELLMLDRWSPRRLLVTKKPPAVHTALPWDKRSCACNHCSGVFCSVLQDPAERRRRPATNPPPPHHRKWSHTATEVCLYHRYPSPLLLRIPPLHPLGSESSRVILPISIAIQRCCSEDSYFRGGPDWPRPAHGDSERRCSSPAPRQLQAARDASRIPQPGKAVVSSSGPADPHRCPIPLCLRRQRGRAVHT